MKRPDFTGISPDVAEYITSLEDRIADITQMLQNLQRLYFGRKSERIRIPAMERDFENVCTTRRFSYLIMSGRQLSPPKSI